MDPLLIAILSVIGGLALGYGIARVLAPGAGAAAEKAAEAEAGKVLEAARAEAEELKKAAQVEGKELAFKLKAQVEDEVRDRKAKLAKQEEAVVQRERGLGKKQKDAEKNEADLAKRERSLEGRERATESMADKAEAARAAAEKRLEEVAGLTAGQARKRLEDEMTGAARAAVAEELKKIEDDAEAEAVAKSQTIIATAIQRYASEFVHERTVATVPLPSDDLKGRLIGREGRNVRAIEAATGTDIIIDDTPELITISCFNPLRREVARIALGSLVADGRIHPTRIEEVVGKAEKEVAKACAEAGEQAVFDLGLHRVHPELVRTLGSLKYRMSYAQNVLMHSVEVGYIAGLMAAEMGVSVKAARRAGLLHDLGKAVDHEQEGPHAEVGAALAKKLRESPKICQAIASHHDDVAPASVLDHIVHAANSLSNSRPGARREQLATYVKRLEDLEKLCKSYANVTNAFAILAGREVRVIVENDKVDDAEAVLLSKDIARKIEDEATYPGQVRVVVLRETRASDYAS
jgi:ribonuclease Y